VEHAGQHLKSALGGSLGEIASGAGDEVTIEVERQRSALLTDTSRPKGEYARVIEQDGALADEIAALDDKIARYQQQVDRLGELRRQQALDESERPWEQYRQQAEENAGKLAEVDAWGAQREREEQALRSCRAQLDLVRDQLARRQAQADDLQERTRLNESARMRLTELQAGQPAVQARWEVSQAAYAQARESLQQAQRHELRQSLEREHRQLAAQSIGDQFNSARQVQDELNTLRTQRQTQPIEAKALKRLKNQQAELDALRIRREAIATRLHFDVLPGQALRLDGQSLSGRGERLLLSVADMEIEGVGRLRIQPGGEDVAELARQQQRAEDALAAGLRALSVATVVEAEQRAQRLHDLGKEIEGKEAMLATLAPKGLDALQSDQQSTAARIEEIAQQLRDLPAAHGHVTTLKTAEARLTTAQQQLSEMEKGAGDARQTLALAERDADTAARELARLNDELQSPERQQKVQQAQQQLTDLRVDEERCAASITALGHRIDAARPDILRQDVQRLSGTAQELEKAASQRKLELTGLAAGVQAQGALGLEEQRAERAREHEGVRRRRSELSRRAGALDLLLGLLHAQRQALMRQLQAPLQKHLDRYVQLLFAQARLSVDENLSPDKLSRRSGSQHEEVGDFEAFSFGAREQMGLISRLAYADLLKEAGRPTLIILDDALVHSDAQRLEQMKRILFDAGQRHQILLFTCHPGNWRDLGVAPRELAALRASS
jgi:chromosome segregation ATPase